MDSLLQGLQPLFVAPLTLWGSPITWVEIAACLLAVAMVVLNMRVNPLAWPLAIISSLLYVALFWNNRLYGESGLQIVFIALATWGWWQWLRGHAADGGELRVRSLDSRSRHLTLLSLALAWPATAMFLKTFTDSDVPWWDAFPTAASLIGQWLLGRKYLENWPIWVLVNLVSVALFAHKELWLTTALYALFVGMSLAGWRAWHRLAAQP